MNVNLSCYHGSICRTEAESILEKINKTGAFLIRNSETFLGSYTLCLWAENGYHQYRIINDGSGFFVKAEVGVEETKYQSLIHLIEYYQNQDSANGLAAPLKIPVPAASSETIYDLKKSTEIKEILSCYFQQKFRYEKHSRFDSTFYHLVEKYLECGLINDLKEIENNNTKIKEIPGLRKLIFDGMKILFESVNDIIEKLNFLNFFFCNSEEDINHKLILDAHDSENLMEDLKSLMDLSSYVKTIESNIISNFCNRLFNTDTNHMSKNASIISTGRISNQNHFTINDSPVSSIKTFEIEFSNVQSSMLQIMCKVSVDIILGKVKLELLHTKTQTILKPMIFHCDSIENISRCTYNSQRLLLKEPSFNGYLSIDFATEADREDFINWVCGAKKLQEIKANKISDCLSIFVGYLDIGSAITVENLCQWLKCNGSGKLQMSIISQFVPHDLYIIAFQEDSKEQQLDAIISSSLNMCYKQDFPLIISKTNSFPKTLYLSLFCRAPLEKYFRNVSCDEVTTGFDTKCGTRGAISISFGFQDLSFCFINCHLPSGIENIERREDEFKIILENITLQRDRSSCVDLISKLDYLFCLGNLSLRKDLQERENTKSTNVRETNNWLKPMEMHRLPKDSNIFKIFREPTISCDVSYQYSQNLRDNCDPLKQLLDLENKMIYQSYNNGILYRGRNNNCILPLSYGINMDHQTSNHNPVFSSFLIALPPRDYVDNNKPLKPSPIFWIEEILIQIKTSQEKLKHPFHFQVECPLLSTVYVSNSPLVINETSTIRLLSNSESKLKDMIPVLDFHQKIILLFTNPFKHFHFKTGVTKADIENGYLFVSVIVNEGQPECLGNCVLSLKQFLSFQVGTFEENLMEHSVPVGSMIIRAYIDARLPECDFNNSTTTTSKLLSWYQNSYSNEDSMPNCRKLIDFINDPDFSFGEVNRLVNVDQHKELSAFRALQPDGGSFHTTQHKTSKLSNMGDGHHSQMSKINGLHFCSSMKIPKNKDVNDYNKERINLFDESCSDPKFSSFTVCKSKRCNCGFGNEEDTITRKLCDISDDIYLTTVHNESYSSTIIRGGVTNQKRNMDARVDLSKLETDMNSIQPPLPPRNGRKNVRAVKTRQEHSNPISIASSSGSSYNANSIGDSSVASAGASCCLPNPDSEFEDTSNDVMRKFSHHHFSYNVGVLSLDDLKKSARADNSSSKQSTITGSDNHICSLSGQYVQAVPVAPAEPIERLIEPYASTKICEDHIERAKKRISNEIEYVMLQRPLDLKDWLNELGIPQKYILKLMSSFFNNIDTIMSAKDEDLKLAGVSELCYRRKILEGITTLRNEIAQ